MKKWIIILVLSAMMLFIVGAPALEAYFHINMPYVEISSKTLSIYGYEIPIEKQFSVMLILGILLMAPTRLIVLAVMKILK